MKLIQLLCLGLSLLLTFPVEAQFTLDVPGATETYVTGINNDDNFCGYYRDSEGNYSGFIRIGLETFAIRIDEQDTWFGGINISNQVVGRYNPSGAANDYHTFIYDPFTDTRTDISDLDGYEFTNPHDINDNGQISGDLKSAANRRFFIWDPDTGLNTQNYLISGSPAPTYGGHSIDNSGRITGYYIDGANYYSFRYHPDFGYLESVDLGDPEVPTVHKTRLMGANGSGKAVLDFVLSDNCHVYDFNDPLGWTGLEKLIPGSTEIHGLDINDSNHIVGYYSDGDGIIHGFADFAISTDFDLNVDGHAFTNSYEDLWDLNWDEYENYYLYDPSFVDAGYSLEFPEISPGNLFPPQSYPPWTSFVNVMSLQSCYYNVNHDGVFYDTPIMRPSAFNSWKINRAENFGGACFGMAANAGASWQYPELLNSKFNEDGDEAFLQDIFNLGDSDILKNAAHEGMAAQSSQTYTSLNAAANTKLPHELLNDLKTIFLAESEMPIVAFSLHISAGLFGHAVFPYAMVPQGLNEYKLFYYDPNAPGSYDSSFDIRYDENLSFYTTQFGEETTSEETYGMKLMLVQEIYEPQLTPGFTGELPQEAHDHHSNDVLAEAGNRDEGDPRIFSLGNNLLNIVGEGGEITVNGSEITNTIAGAQPWLKYGGQAQTLNQFILPVGSYEIVTTESEEDAYFTGGVIDGESIIMFHRYESELADDDKLILNGSELSYVNQSGAATPIFGEVITQVGGSEYHFEINDLDLDPDQSVSLEFIDDGLYISNDGTNTNYNVVLEVFEADGEMHTTEVSNIPIGEGITQIIIPRFIGDYLDGVIITETDNDPETEDVEIEVGNTGLPLMIVSTDSLLLTNDGQLAQFGVGNIGAGILNWTVSSSPAWAPVGLGSPGSNYGSVDLNVEENTGEPREGNIVVQNNDNVNDTRTIYIQQSDLNNSINALNTEGLVMMPNPAIKNLQVKIPTLLQGKNPRYSILTLEGKEVMSGYCPNNTLDINLSGLAAGVYVFKLGTDEIRYVEQLLKVNP